MGRMKTSRNYFLVPPKLDRLANLMMRPPDDAYIVFRRHDMHLFYAFPGERIGDVPLEVTPMTLGGIINQESDDTLAFTPDGNTVFFDRSEGPRKTIMISHRINGHWSSPQPASFSGRWFD